MHPGIYSLTLFLDKEVKLRLGDSFVTFPEGFYVYVQGHTDAHGRVDEHMKAKGSYRIDLFLKKAHVVDTKVSKLSYGSGKVMLKDLLKIRNTLLNDFNGQLTPIIGLYHVDGPHVASSKYSGLFS
jgi:Uri superfamily endonuclease